LLNSLKIRELVILKGNLFMLKLLKMLNLVLNIAKKKTLGRMALGNLVKLQDPEVIINQLIMVKLEE